MNDDQPITTELVSAPALSFMDALDDLRAMLRHVNDAMSDEGIPADTRRRVINRVLLGEPDGL